MRGHVDSAVTQFGVDSVGLRLAIEHLDNREEVRAELLTAADHVRHLVPEPIDERTFVKSDSIRDLLNRLPVIEMSSIVSISVVAQTIPYARDAAAPPIRVMRLDPDRCLSRD